MGEENPNVQEVVQPETTSQEPHVPDNMESTKLEETPISDNTDSDKEYNFKQLREQNAQLQAQLRAQDEASRNNEIKAANPFSLGEDDLVEGKHLNAHFQKVEKLLLNKERELVPDRLRSKYADFDNVVSNENVEKFKQNEPEFFESIQAQNPELLSGHETYSKAVSLYKMMKASGYGVNEAEKKKIEANQAKPMSIQSLQGGNTALSEANILATQGLTSELKAKYNKEMQEAIKRG